MYKPLADSTLMNMTKKEIIEHLRCAEHNHRVCEEQIEQQYKNCKKLLKEERADTINEFRDELRNLLFDDGRYQIVTENDIDKVAEKLKEQS